MMFFLFKDIAQALAEKHITQLVCWCQQHDFLNYAFKPTNKLRDINESPAWGPLHYLFSRVLHFILFSVLI